MANRIYELFADDVLPEDERKALIQKTLSRFKTPEVALNRQGGLSILELFPRTHAFL